MGSTLARPPQGIIAPQSRENAFFGRTPFKPEAILFDLDQNLVDSSGLEALRKARNWNAVYEQIPVRMSVYAGIHELLDFLKVQDVPMSIVTSAPKSYAQRVLAHFRLTGFFSDLVAYHDVQWNQQKPDPAQLILSARHLKVNITCCWGVGDRLKDAQAAKRAGAYAVATLWGSGERELLINAPEVDARFETVASFHLAITELFPNIC